LTDNRIIVPNGRNNIRYLSEENIFSRKNDNKYTKIYYKAFYGFIQ